MVEDVDACKQDEGQGIPFFLLQMVRSGIHLEEERGRANLAGCQHAPYSHRVLPQCSTSNMGNHSFPNLNIKAHIYQNEMTGECTVVNQQQWQHTCPLEYTWSMWYVSDQPKSRARTHGLHGQFLPIHYYKLNSWQQYY